MLFPVAMRVAGLSQGNGASRVDPVLRSFGRVSVGFQSQEPQELIALKTWLGEHKSVKITQETTSCITEHPTDWSLVLHLPDIAMCVGSSSRIVQLADALSFFSSLSCRVSELGC